MQYYNVYFTWKLSSTFRVIPLPITISDNSYLHNLSLLYERSKIPNFGIYGQRDISLNTYLNRYHCDTPETRMLCIFKNVYIFGKVLSEIFVWPFEHINLFSYSGSSSVFQEVEAQPAQDWN
jgi:hypothetical protein